MCRDEIYARKLVIALAIAFVCTLAFADLYAIPKYLSLDCSSSGKPGYIVISECTPK